MPLNRPIEVFVRNKNPECPMDPRENHNFETETVAENRLHPKYFVEKREIGNGPIAGPSHQPVAGPSNQPISAPSNQPIAGPSNQPIAGPSNQPIAGPSNQPIAGPSNPPIAGPSNPPIVRPPTAPIGKKYRFTATHIPLGEMPRRTEYSKKFIASIDCQNSKIDRIQYPIDRKVHRKWYKCGIEARLFSLCFYDRDVNPIPMAKNHGYLNEVFSHYGRWSPRAGGGNAREIITAHDPDNVMNLVRSYCANFVEVNVPWRTGQTYANLAEKLRHAIMGAYFSGYIYMAWLDVRFKSSLSSKAGQAKGVPFTQSCAPRWAQSETWHMLQMPNDPDFQQWYQDTSDFGMWYFCRRSINN